MNTIHSNFKKFFIISFLLLSFSIKAQTPMFYNSNNGTYTLGYPFDFDNHGKKIQYLVRAHEFNLLYPSYSGYIIKLYFLMGSNCTKSFTNFTLKLGQTTLTDLPSGTIYTGQLDTVFFKDTATFTSTTGHWMPITLDKGFTYDTSKSLVIDLSYCQMLTSYFQMWVKGSSVSGTRVTVCDNSSCITAYQSQSSYLPNLGIDIIPLGLPPKSYYFTQWCPVGRYPPIPSPSVYGAAAIIGDTLYMEIGSADGATASTLFYKYTISGNAWHPCTPLPAPRCQGTLTACNGALYYIGGASSVNGAPVSDVFQYSPATGQWVTKANIPYGYVGHSMHNWGDSLLILMGGHYSGGGYASMIWYYKPSTNTWNESSTQYFGFDFTSFHAGGTMNNKMYLACGHGQFYTNQLAIGTFGNDADHIFWSAGPPIPSSGKSGIGGVAVRGRFYIIGGQNLVLGPPASDSSFIYDLTANQWQIVTSLKPHPVANVNASTVAWVNQDSVRVVCLGGSDLTHFASTYFDVIGCGPVEIGIQNISGPVPAAFSLMQNYPNPFNPTTKIEYSVPKPQKVYLKIYDILGREIAVLVNEFKTPGKYEVEFDGTNFASGLYFYKITAGSFTETKKMVLLK